MKRETVYVIADIEGVAGVVFYEYRGKDMSMLNFELLKRNRMLMTEEVNAAARGAFEAGAESVIVYDHHGTGYNIMPELIDERIELIHGRHEQAVSLGIPHPDLNENVDALVLLGMHAKAGTLDGCTPHSYISVETKKGVHYGLSEATMSMAAAGDYGIPTAFIAGDRATVDDALALNPEMKFVMTKKHYASQLARTISPILSRKLIQSGVRSALECETIRPFKIEGPCAVRIGDRNPEALWPEKANSCATFNEALTNTLQNVPWYKTVDMIDDGWRFPDKTTEFIPESKWNFPLKKM